jgi:hypothetical protein
MDATVKISATIPTDVLKEFLEIVSDFAAHPDVRLSVLVDADVSAEEAKHLLPQHLPINEFSFHAIEELLLTTRGQELMARAVSRLSPTERHALLQVLQPS